MEKENKPAFDFEAFKKQAAARLKKGETLLGKEGVFTPLIKEFLEEALDGELEAHIESQDEPNRKNGKGRKRVKTTVGNVDISTPRDRNGTFEPDIIAKRQKTAYFGRVDHPLLSSGFDRLKLFLFCLIFLPE